MQFPKRILFVTFAAPLLLPTAVDLEAQVPTNYTEAKKVYWRGHLAFTENRYSDAIDDLSLVEAYVKKKPEHKNYFDHNYRNFSLLELVRSHRRLGDFVPQTTHKVLVLYIGRTDTDFRGKTIKENFTPELKKTAYVSQEVCKKYFEVLSGGKLSLEFDRLQLDATLTRLAAFPYEGPDKDARPMETVHAELESLQPYPGKLLLEKSNDYDSFLFYYHSGNLSLPNGGGATAIGGSLNFYFVPYTLAGPERGRILVSDRLIDKPGTLFHELFHTIEQRYKIKPGHGFWPNHRQHFPGWQGQGEFDYYRYHFNNTIRPAGYAKFEFRHSWPNSTTVAHLQKIKQQMHSTSADDLHQAHQLFFKAQTMYQKGEPETKKALYRVLALNPWHARALYLLCILEYQGKQKQVAYKLIKRAYLVAPYDSYICYWMGVMSYHRQEIGKAVQYLSESLVNDPDYDSAWQYRGFVHYQMGKYDKARDDFAACLSKSDRFQKWIRQFLIKQNKRGDLNAEKIASELEISL